MKNLFELAYRHVTPAIRRALVLELLRKGFTEAEIARALSISKSLVTRYVKGERGDVAGIHEHPLVRGLMNRLADKIVSGDVSGHEVEAEVVRAVALMFSTKQLCEYHSRLDPEVSPLKCNVCPTIFRV